MRTLTLLGALLALALPAHAATEDPLPESPVTTVDTYCYGTSLDAHVFNMHLDMWDVDDLAWLTSQGIHCELFGNQEVLRAGTSGARRIGPGGRIVACVRFDEYRRKGDETPLYKWEWPKKCDK